MLYTFYIFHRSQKCLVYEAFARTRPSQDLKDEQRLIFGLIVTMKSIVSTIDKVHTFNTITTKHYKMHVYETASGYYFVVTSDPNVPDLRDALKHIHSELFTQVLLRDPTYEPGTPIEHVQFMHEVRQFFQLKPYFSS